MDGNNAPFGIGVGNQFMFPNYVFAQGLPSSMPPFASMGDLGLASAGASTHPGQQLYTGPHTTAFAW